MIISVVCDVKCGEVNEILYRMTKEPAAHRERRLVLSDGEHQRRYSEKVDVRWEPRGKSSAC